jgi:hypothetical protein
MSSPRKISVYNLAGTASEIQKPQIRQKTLSYSDSFAPFTVASRIPTSPSRTPSPTRTSQNKARASSPVKSPAKSSRPPSRDISQRSQSPFRLAYSVKGREISPVKSPRVTSPRRTSQQTPIPSHKPRSRTDSSSKTRAISLQNSPERLRETAPPTPRGANSTAKSPTRVNTRRVASCARSKRDSISSTEIRR